VKPIFPCRTSHIAAHHHAKLALSASFGVRASGASQKTMPRTASSSASARVSVGSEVDVSITIAPFLAPATIPSLPRISASTSARAGHAEENHVAAFLGKLLLPSRLDRPRLTDLDRRAVLWPES